jgi:capsular polysaccharide export protein
MGLQALQMGKAIYCIGQSIYGMKGLAENRQEDSLDHFWNQYQQPNPELLAEFEKIVRCRTSVNGNFYYGQGMEMALQGCADRLTASLRHDGATA